jgi:hypothetical protein
MSGGDAVEGLRAKLQADESLRQRFREDPEGVLSEHGLPVDDGVRESLARHDVRNMSDADLAEKLSAPEPAQTLFSSGA